MGVLQRFERRVEELVNRPFARAFKAEVQPVEIASALQRELDEELPTGRFQVRSAAEAGADAARRGARPRDGSRAGRGPSFPSVCAGTHRSEHGEAGARLFGLARVAE